MSNPQLLAVLPLRLQSARIPHKMLKKIGGQELAVRTVRRALAALRDLPRARVVAAVDSEALAKLLRQQAPEVEVVLTDPALPSGTDRVFAAALQWLDQAKLKRESLRGVLNIQGDMPFVGAAGLKQIAAYYLESEAQTLLQYPVSTLSVPWPEKVKLSDDGAVKVIVDRSDRAIYFSRHPLPDASLHVGVYGYTLDALARFCAHAPVPLETGERLEQLRALHLGMPILVLRTQEAAGESFRGIDTAKDLAWAQKFCKAPAKPAKKKK